MSTASLTGQRALVTGGSRGIGAEIVRRLTADGDVAALVSFLAGTESGYITGANLNVDGGYAV